MKLSVVIVSYNVWSYLRQCLDSLGKALEGVEAEIYVIDNHSKDNTVELVRREFPNVRLIASGQNHGFAKANNIAIRQTKSEYVLLINPDTFVGESVIKDCLSFMDSHEKAGGLGVCMLKSDGSRAMESRRGLPTPMTAFYKMCGLCARYPKSRRFGHYYMGYLPWDEPARIEVVSGAFFMLRRTALMEAGLLDEDFFMYGEDIDLSYRLVKRGYENWYLPVRILHYKGESTEKSSFRYVHVFYEAMLIFFKKHYGHLSIWFNVPVKTAIYMKATMALIEMSCQHVRKILGFSQYVRRRSVSYVFVGSAETLAKCQAIADRNGLEATCIETTEEDYKRAHANIISNIDGRNKTFVVYDVSSRSYGEILEMFAEHQKQGVFIGTYDPKTDVVITDERVIS